MDKLIAVIVGILAWLAVGAIAVLIVFNMGGKNQVLMFLPIAAAVLVAWAVGEVVTERVFIARDEEV